MKKFILNYKSINKTVALCLGVILVLSLSVATLAATAYNWGPNSFTPYTGSFVARNNYVSAFGMEWTEDQVSTFQLAQSGISFQWLTTEYEFRPSSYSPHEIWEAGTETFSSNLPDAYYEFQPDDEDDIAVCSGWAAGYEADTTYYGRMYMSAADDAPSSAQYIFESEYGITIPLFDDSLPSCYEQYNLCPTYFGTYYEW